LRITATPVLLFLAAVHPVPAATTAVVEGNPGGAVKVTIYEDLQCDYCENLRTMLDEKLLPRYGKQVVFIHHDMPLGRHDWARTAAMVARWVYEQDPHLGIVFRRELLAEQEHVTKATLKPWVIEFAKRNQLSEQGMEAALTDPRLGAIVDQDIQLAMSRGIKKLPAVFVAGQTFEETIVFDDLAHAIDLELAR
jgi:protein-disulfide isomerase